MEIGEFLKNMQQLEGNTPKEMQQLWLKAMKHLVSNGVLYQRQKTNELLAKVLVISKQKRKIMEAEHELRRYCRRVGTWWKVVGWYRWPEMYINIKYWVKTYKWYKKTVPILNDEHLKSITVSRHGQQVGMDVLYMPKMDYGTAVR